MNKKAVCINVAAILFSELYSAPLIVAIFFCSMSCFYLYYKEYYTSIYVDYLLTSGFTSLLMEKLRTEYNLVYSIDSEINVSDYSSYYEINFSTLNKKNAKQCLRLISECLEEIAVNGVKEETYNYTRNKIELGKSKLPTLNKVNAYNKFYTNLIVSGKSIGFLNLETFYDNILKVTRKDIQNFVKNYLNFKNVVIFYTGKN